MLGLVVIALGCEPRIETIHVVVPPRDQSNMTGATPAAGSSPVAISTITINEIQTANHSTVMGETGEFSDWVELYNPTDSAISLDRLSLQDSSGERWNGGEGSLAAGETLLLWADGLTLPFRLDVDGETLAL